MIARKQPVNQSEIDLFKREETAEQFLSRLPPDARPIVLPDGSVVIQEGNKTYNVPTSINNEVRKIVSNVTDLPSRQYTTTTGSGSAIQQYSFDDNVVESLDMNVDQGSDFLTNVGGVGATTFDYDLSEPDLLEAIELRKSAYGVDKIETSSTVNAQGEEQKSFIDRVGDRLYEVFVTGPSEIIQM